MLSLISDQVYRFPAIVKLKEQSVLSGEQKLNLQSGMIVSNIKLRSHCYNYHKRHVHQTVDGVKRFR